MGSSSDPFFQGKDEGFGTVFGAELNGWDVHLSPGVVVPQCTTWAFFFLTALLAVTSYHTNKTRLAEAPFGPVGDDNGPGSEPPPHDRLR
ncbi:hypothetical protein THAOC_23002, partial [Thalassiosira oceanica]